MKSLLSNHHSKSFLSAAALSALSSLLMAQSSFGQIYVADYNASTVIELSDTGAVLNSSFIQTEPDPLAGAVDSAGNFWIVSTDFGMYDNLSEYSAAGTLLKNRNLGLPGGLTSTRGVAVDASGDVFIGSSTGVTEFFSGGGGRFFGSAGGATDLTIQGNTLYYSHTSGGVGTINLTLNTQNDNFISSSLEPEGRGLLVDNNNNLFVAGVGAGGGDVEEFNATTGALENGSFYVNGLDGGETLESIVADGDTLLVSELQGGVEQISDTGALLNGNFGNLYGSGNNVYYGMFTPTPASGVPDNASTFCLASAVVLGLVLTRRGLAGRA